MSRSRKSENISCDLTKKMNTHTLCFCPLIKKLQEFEIMKWAQGSQWRKQRISNFTREIQNTAFDIFTAVKYSFFKICIIFNQYFSVFHYFVYNKCHHAYQINQEKVQKSLFISLFIVMNFQTPSPLYPPYLSSV